MGSAFLSDALPDLVERRAGAFALALRVRQDAAPNEDVADDAFILSLVEILIGGDQGIRSIFEAGISTEQEMMGDNEFFRRAATKSGAQFP